jgi:hypothetical protein
MKLTFIKDFPGPGGDVVIQPMTVEGDIIDNVVSCSVESGADAISTMTLKVLITEQFSDQVARRLKGKGEYAR